MVDDHLNATASELGQAWHRVIERIDQHLVATAQQFPRQEDELSLGATSCEAADYVENAQRRLGSSQWLIQRARHIWKASSSHTLSPACLSPARKRVSRRRTTSASKMP